MSYMGKDYDTIIAAGCQNVMLKVDVEKGRVIEKVRSLWPPPPPWVF